MGNTNGGVSYNDQIIKDFARTSGLTDIEVRENCRYWLKKHPDGKMYKEDVKEMMGQALSGISEEDAEKMQNHLFRIYDDNQNGFVEFHEFMTVFSIFTAEESVSVLEKVFRIFDVDSNGTITKEEMLILVTDMHALIKQNIKNPSDEEIALQAFEEMDANEDGLVTKEEFVEAVLSHKKFSQYLAMKIFNIFDDGNL
eukprot:GFUD01011321.1.p1 GENE.GFUD01011321.1~~GFUD01011321.1.p1  ORF type:complete len:205 (+),score=66.24 GFUD01011321.1:23-616(+)